jgi:hypothetical protein
MPTKIRRVRSRGHTYLQEVEYTWDRSRKRGITRIIRQLGPETPLNPNRYEQSVLDEGKARLREQERRSQSRREQRLWNPNARRQIGGHRGGRTAKQEPNLPPLLPDQELIERVYAVVRELAHGATRRVVFEVLKRSGNAPNEDERDARTHVGFALTMLSRSGRLIACAPLRRRGAYSYSMPDSSVTQPK